MSAAAIAREERRKAQLKRLTRIADLAAEISTNAGPNTHTQTSLRKALLAANEAAHVIAIALAEYRVEDRDG